MSKMNYYLRKNPLAGENDSPYMARVARKETLRQDDVIARMLRKNTTVTRQDILVVLDLLKETVMEEALSGNPIIMDLFKIQSGIRGGFASWDDEFDLSRHRLNLNMNASVDFKKEFLKSAELTRVGAKEEKLAIEQIFDYETWTLGETFPAGGTIELRGRNLMSEVEPEITLTREDTGEAYSVTKVFNHGEKSILCSLPADLAAGPYTMSAVLKKGLKTISVDYGNPITIT